VKRIIALVLISVFVLSLNAAYAANRKSEDAKEPVDTPIFLPFYIIDKALTPPADYEERFHKTIEEEMQEDHLKAKAAAGR